MWERAADAKKLYSTPTIERISMFLPNGGFLGLGKANHPMTITLTRPETGVI